MQCLTGRLFGSCAALTLLISTLAASPAFADADRSGNGPCSSAQLSQPFLSANDENWYMLAPGQTTDSFNADGWTLSGGAKIITTRLADGQTGQVLDLPSGSKAVSPTMCVNSDFQTARTMIRNVTGAEGVFFYVSYAGTSTWTNPQNTGQVHGNHSDWTLSDPVNVQPSNRPGEQHVRFTLIPGGHASDFEIYDFYVDPRMI